ncbi:DUF2971 domain-containing protein [Halomonas denitrificans]|uniref:DUF2971 domain-containing protein n=1 Tax=Halomonas denitrificans TaxID=370769 RepID=UPI001CD69433|nr:DUF2971 domain-containing protein [Halomonas denitrificans]MCA0973109.1 DUF2971 domain-containing protein [Halomonas denitrificans]
MESFRIRFTPLLSLNDPFEYSLKIGDSEYELKPELSAENTETMAFVSLSRNNSNILMWSHYADSHKGFCLGFYRSDSYFSDAESIRYRSNRSSLNGMSNSHFDKINVLKSVALEKAIDWAYEEEERLFLCDVENKINNIGLDGWGQPILLNSFPKTALGAVYLGLRASNELEIKIKKILQLNNMHTPIFKAQKSINKFGIEFWPRT